MSRGAERDPLHRQLPVDPVLLLPLHLDGPPGECCIMFSNRPAVRGFFLESATPILPPKW
jgi:hypothetical protein